MSNRISSLQRELAEANRKVSNTLFVPAEKLSRQQRRCRMKRRFQGLEETTQLAGNEVPDGLFLVRVDGAKYRWHAQKPFYWLRLAVLEPREFVGRTISGRLYCTPKALWKLAWFLRDFLYDVELLGRAEVDEKALFRASRYRQDQPHYGQRPISP
jgi:hypothetical protein